MIDTYQFNYDETSKLGARNIKTAAREGAWPPQNAPAPLQVDLFTLKVMSESRVTWPTAVKILVRAWYGMVWYTRV